MVLLKSYEDTDQKNEFYKSQQPHDGAVERFEILYD